jgi:hypothetical protein
MDSFDQLLEFNQLTFNHKPFVKKDEVRPRIEIYQKLVQLSEEVIEIKKNVKRINIPESSITKNLLKRIEIIEQVRYDFDEELQS